ncbi:MAG: lysostaphin resistance A-like protein [Actinomycetes bacterium]
MAEPGLAPGTAGERYPQLLRTGRVRWWQPLLGLLLAGVTLVSGAVAVILGAVALHTLTGSADDPFSDEALQPDSPLGLFANNLVIAVMVPASVLAVLAVHRQRVGLLASVVGRVRWGLLARLLVLALVLVAVFFGGSFWLPSSSTTEVAVPGAGTLAALLAVIALTTPLQAAAEEVGFRGYLSQAVAAWFARRVVGTLAAGVVSAVLFALAHGAQDPWLFGDRLAFGVVASWLAWRTGGLEAPMALHVANNVVSLSFSAVTGSLEDSLTASTLEWQFAASDVAMMLSFAVLVDRLARRWRVDVRSPRAALTASAADVPAVRGALAGSGEVGYPGPRPSTPPPAGGDNPWGMG